MHNFERNTSWVLLTCLTLMLSVQVVARYVFFTSIAWIEEFSRIVFMWFLYLSISWVIIQGRHIRINALDLALSPSGRRLVALLADSIWLAFNILMTYYGARFVASEIEVYSETAILRLPDAAVHAIIPFGFGLMTVRLVQCMVRVYLRGEPEVLLETRRLEEEV